MKIKEKEVIESVDLVAKAKRKPKEKKTVMKIEVPENGSNKIPDFKTLQEAMADPNTIRFIKKRIAAIETARDELKERMNKQLAEFNYEHGRPTAKPFRIKRSAYDFLKENRMLSVDSITRETILIAQKKSTRQGEVRAFIEVISHNAIADMLNFYMKGEPNE